jgi:anti-anti-sigma regulatory factor
MTSVSATTVQVDGVVIVAFVGHLTGATLLQVESHLAPLLREVPPVLVVDLSRVRTCDTTGALILDVAARVAADHDGELRLAAPPAAICRALRQAGTMQTVRTFGTVNGAVHGDVLDLLATPERSATEEPAQQPEPP